MRGSTGIIQVSRPYPSLGVAPGQCFTDFTVDESGAALIDLRGFSGGTGQALLVPGAEWRYTVAANTIARERQLAIRHGRLIYCGQLPPENALRLRLIDPVHTDNILTHLPGDELIKLNLTQWGSNGTRAGHPVFVPAIHGTVRYTVVHDSTMTARGVQRRLGRFDSDGTDDRLASALDRYAAQVKNMTAPEPPKPQRKKRRRGISH